MKQQENTMLAPIMGVVFCPDRDPASDFLSLQAELKQLVAGGSLKLSIGAKEKARAAPGLVAGVGEPLFELFGWFFKGWKFATEAPLAVEHIQQTLAWISDTVGEYQQVIVFMVLNEPTLLRMKRVIDELRLSVKVLPTQGGIEVPKADEEYEVSGNGKRRAEYRTQMGELVNQKRQAWADGNVEASEEISAKMRGLLEKEAELGSGAVGVVIRT